MQALLCDELADAKKAREEAKKKAKLAAQAEKNCLKRRSRLLKARGRDLMRWVESMFLGQAAKGLSSEDLELLVAAKKRSNSDGESADVPAEKNEAGGPKHMFADIVICVRIAFRGRPQISVRQLRKQLRQLPVQQQLQPRKPQKPQHRRQRPVAQRRRLQRQSESKGHCD